MAELTIQTLEKRYENGVLGLQDINLSMRSGEFVVLVGPSGCGKSTLLRCVAGLERPTGGSIEINGRRVNDLSPSERAIGMVFQDYALYPHMSVFENLAFGLQMKRLPSHEIKIRVQEVSAMLGLKDLLIRKPSQLSGGQRQRVAIGRALVKRPSVLLLDEPLSNLDAQLRAQTRLEIAALHRKINSTTIYVTHDQEEAMTLADRIVVLKSGRIQQIDAPLVLYQNPTNRFVASFIGSPQMNFLEGELRSENNGRWNFETEGQRIEVSESTHPLRAGRFVLGFRPESALLAAQGPTATLVWIELHGHEIHVVARLKKKNITLRTADAEMIRSFRAMPLETRFSLQIKPSEIHWFEPSAEGRRITGNLNRSVA